MAFLICFKVQRIDDGQGGADNEYDNDDTANDSGDDDNNGDNDGMMT